MATTYTLINSNVLSSSAASVTFSSIPATYTDLVLQISARSDRANESDVLDIRINNNSSSLYSLTNIQGDGASATSTSVNNNSSTYGSRITGANATANTFGTDEIYIPSYLVAQNKPFGEFGAQETNSSTAYIRATAHLFRSTTAISEIRFIPTFGTNFVSGSSFYLYGISNA